MSIIDERIVKMVFDNGNFMNAIGPTLSALTNLNKETDDFAEKASGIDEIGKAFNRTEMMATSAGFHIRDVWEKFTRILEYDVARKIKSVVYDIGNALSFEGIKSGFAEYELKMGSVQTIMAGTGESIAKVNQYLDELNTYSDKTIYSFADMTNNIGKFTNAGVKLGDAVAAIKGIANEAARSGANANEASRAMYNFSQALSAGYVKLIDWKSIENANMATKEFKDTLLEVASSCGTVKKDSNGMYQVLTKNANGATMKDVMSATRNFNDSLSFQWMTTDVLTKALKIYATDVLAKDVPAGAREAYESELKLWGMTDDQIKKFEELGHQATLAASEVKTFSMLIDTLKEAIQSGWAQTWEILIGDLEEAKALWTEVSNVLGGYIDNMSEARNELLREFDALGGRRALIASFKSAFQALVAVIKPIGEAIKNVFPPATADQLAKLTIKLSYYIEKLKISKETAEKVKSVFSGFFSVIDAGIRIIGGIVKAMLPLTNVLKEIGKRIFDAAANVGEFLTKLNNVLKLMGAYEKLGEVIVYALTTPIRFILNHIDVVTNVIITILNLINTIHKVFSVVFKGIEDLIVGMINGFKKAEIPVKSFGDVINNVLNGINKVLDKVRDKLDWLGPIFEGLGKGVEVLAGLVGKVLSPIIEFLAGSNATGNGNILTTVKSFINLFITGGIVTNLYSSAKAITEFATAVHTAMSTLITIKWGILTEAIKDVAIAIGIVSGSLLVISLIDTDKLFETVGALASAIVVFTGAVSMLVKTIGGLNINSIETKVTKLFKWEILKGSSKSGIVEMAAVLASLSTAMISFGAAILELAGAMAIVAKVAESGHLLEAWGIITLLLAELTATSIILSKFVKVKLEGMFSMIELAAAAYLLVAAVNKVAKAVDEYGAKMIPAIVIVAGLIAEMAIIEYKLTDLSFGGATAIAACFGMIEMAGAVLMLVGAIKNILKATDDFTAGQIWASFGLVSALLGELTVFMSVFAGLGTVTGGLGIAGVIASALGAVAVAGAVLLFVQAMKSVCKVLDQFGGTAWASLGYLAVVLVELAGGLTLMAGCNLGAIALSKAAVGLIELAGAMMAFSYVQNWWILLTLPVLLIEIGVALDLLVLAVPGALALKLIAPALGELALSVVALGNVPWNDIGAFIAKFAVSVAALGGVSVILSLCAAPMIAVAGALAILAGAMAVAGPAMVAFAAGVEALLGAIPALATAIGAILNLVLALIPKIVVAIFEGLGQACTTIVKYGPAFGEAASIVMRSTLETMSQFVPEFGKTIVNIITGILDVLSYAAPVIGAAVVGVFKSIFQVISVQIPELANYGWKCITAFVLGISKGIIENTHNAVESFNLLLAALGYSILEFITNLPILGVAIPQSLKDGILQGEQAVLDEINSMMDQVTADLNREDEARANSKATFDAAVEEAKKGSKEYKDAAQDMAEEPAKSLGGSEDKTTDAAQSIMNEIVKVISGGKEGLGSGMDLSFEGVIESLQKNGIDTEALMSVIGLKSGKGLANNFAQGTEGMPEEMQKLYNQFSDLWGITDRYGNLVRGSKSEIQQYRVAIKDADGEIIDYTYKLERELTNEERRMFGLKVATDEVTESTKEFSTATKEAGETTRKNVTVFEYGAGVIEAFRDTYGHLYNAMSDEDAWNVAKLAIENFAIATYEASGKALETTKNTKQAKDYITEMVEEFTNLKKKVVDSISSVFQGDSFFQTFEVKTEKTMEEILHSMHTNIDGVANWSTKLAELGEKGINQGLLQQLAELGPKGFEYVNAFSNATTEQIQQANEMFAEAGRLKEAESNKIIASYANAGLMATIGFRDGMLGQMVEAEAAASSLGITTLKELREALGIHSPSEETRKIGVYAVEGLRNGIDNQTARAQVLGVIKMLCDRVVNSFSEQLSRGTFFEFGKDISLGLANGIESQIGAVREAARKISEAASVTTTKFNLIKSPSRLYRQYGGYISEGFALGIEDGITTVEDSAYAMSEAIRDTIEMAESIAEGDMELHPVISPVLDLSEVQANAGLIGKLFPSQSLAMASSIGIGKDNYVADGSTSAPVAPASINVTQNNYSPKALDRYEIYRQTSNLVSQLKGAMA